MIVEQTQIIINRPLKEVFSFITDLDKFTFWFGSMVEIKAKSDGPVGQDTTFQSVTKFLGRRLETSNKVVEYEPDHSFAIQTIDGPVSATLRWVLDPVEGGTQVTGSFEGEFGGFFKLAEPLLVRAVKRQAQIDFETLKDLLEA